MLEFMVGLGFAIFGQGKYEEAEQMYRQALEQAEALLSVGGHTTFFCRKQLEECLRLKEETLKPEN